MEALHYRLKVAAAEAIKTLNLRSDDRQLVIGDNVQSQMQPDVKADTSNLSYPCVVVAHVLGSERDNSGTTLHKWKIYPLWVLILDAETARWHEREETYLKWREKIWDLFNDRRAAFKRPLLTLDQAVPEVNWCKCVGGSVIDPRWQALQTIASHVQLEVHTIQDRKDANVGR